MQVYFDFNFSNQKHMIKLNSQLQGSPVASAPAPNTYGTPQATPAQPAPDNYGSPQGSAIGTGGGSGFNAFVGGTPNSNFQTSSQGRKISIVVISSFQCITNELLYQITIQGDPSRSSLGYVDIKPNLAFWYIHLLLKSN